VEWDSSPRNLFVLGISLLILGTSVMSTDIDLVWVGTLRYYFFIVGVTLIIMAVAFILRDRRAH
jgi:type IV secretory pathway VirB3-like protein